MTVPTQRGYPAVDRGPAPGTVPTVDTARALQALRFRLLTELGRGRTPMREVNACFERVVDELRGSCPGLLLPVVVERAVRSELSVRAVVAVA
jgi:hypothetical protein